MFIDSHFLRIVSISIMLLEPRYKTGVNLCVVATFCSWLIGDLICLPVANQNSSSHTQKSSSVCDAIACLSVMITSSIVSKCFSIEFR